MTSERDAELLSRIFEALPGGIVEVGPAGVVRRANQRALDTLGVPREALMGRHLGDLDGETVREDGSACPAGEHPAALCLSTGEPQGPTTVGVRQPDGELRWAVVTALPAQMPGEEWLGAVVTLFDITEQRAAEVRARTHGQLLDTARLVHSTDPAAIAATLIEPLDGLLTMTGSRFGFVAARAPEDPLEASELSVLSMLDRDRATPGTHPPYPLDVLSERALRGGGPVVVASPDAPGGVFGRRTLTSAFVAPLAVGDRVVGLLGLADAPSGYSESMVRGLAPLVSAAADVLVAIAERRRKSRVEVQLAHAERLASIGTLAAGVAHEVNNPLAYVLLNVEASVREARRINERVAELRADLAPRIAADELDRLLSDLAEPAERLARYCRDANDGAERVQLIVRDLMAFSRVGSDQARLVDINATVEVAIKMAFHEIKYRARLERDLGDVRLIFGNEGRLSQVLLNLLLNAARAIEEGDPERNAVRVRTRMKGALVEISVEDTGRGIEPSHIDQIFEPFFTTREPGAGVGFGLSICQDVVSAHGGHIEVESEVGSGARFTVTLPVAPPGAQLDVCAEAPAVAAEVEPARRRVLIVDDEAMVLSVLGRLMERSFDVDVADGCRAAIEILNRDPGPDAVICDMMMLDGTGMDVHAWLCEHRPALARRVIFATGGTFTPKAREFLRDVAVHHLAKPFRIAELDEMIERVLSEG